jgi:hypothetical protein
MVDGPANGSDLVASDGIRRWGPIADVAERSRVLDALEDELTGHSSADPPLPGSPLPLPGLEVDLRLEGLDWPSTALTMVGRKRLRNYRDLIERSIEERIPGDILEAGVWRGGASILARAVLAVRGVTDRTVYVADSFAGLPPPDPANFVADADSTLHTFAELAVSLEQVQRNFARYGLLDDQVRFVPGWFRDTLSDLAPSVTLAVLRLDGDLYESTIESLTALYDSVAPGGSVIIDDYYLLDCCRAAVRDFFSDRDSAPEVVRIDHVGAYLRKP